MIEVLIGIGVSALVTVLIQTPLYRLIPDVATLLLGRVVIEGILVSVLLSFTAGITASCVTLISFPFVLWIYATLLDKPSVRRWSE